MAKPKQEVATKTSKQMIKDIETRMVGMKNKKEKASLLKQIENIKLKDELAKKEKQKRDAINNAPIVQLIPVGLDPKSVQCVNYLNKVCQEGERCRFAHELKKVEKAETKNEETNKPKLVCRFMIDSMNAGEYSGSWVCPIPRCRDIHKLVELSRDSKAEVSLEEYIELSRQALGEKLTPVTEESFKAWKLKKLNEENAYKKKKEAMISSGLKGVDLFKANPELFMDDEEAVEVNYKERCYSDDEEEEDRV